MKDSVRRNLASNIDAPVVEDILRMYEGLIAKQRISDFEGALTRAGKFVEHVFRALEFIRTGTAPKEVKSPAKTAKTIENDTSLPETIRLLIPRIALAMIYDIRSKRGAVHVKEIDPRQIDVELAVNAASWIIAEFVRLYHVDEETAVTKVMAALTRTNIPAIEAIGGEEVVTRVVPPKIEILLLLARNNPDGATRRQIGKAAKCSPPRVTEALQALEKERYVHKTSGGSFHITGPGEAFLADRITAGAN